LKEEAANNSTTGTTADIIVDASGLGADTISAGRDDLILPQQRALACFREKLLSHALFEIASSGFEMATRCGSSLLASANSIGARPPA
jgi:hypothetical protein